MGGGTANKLLKLSAFRLQRSPVARGLFTTGSVVLAAALPFADAAAA